MNKRYAQHKLPGHDWEIECVRNRLEAWIDPRKWSHRDRKKTSYDAEDAKPLRMSGADQKHTIGRDPQGEEQ